jgi:hypothetical protein
MLALVHHHHPDEFNYDTVDKSDSEANFKLAFETAEKYGVPQVTAVASPLNILAVGCRRHGKYGTTQLDDICFRNVPTFQKIN